MISVSHVLSISSVMLLTIPSRFQHVVLVGGFAASDWLFNKVHEALTPLGLNILRPESHVYVFFQNYLDLLD
jgi:hypothetical protein